MQDQIIIRGAREHNLQNVSLALPRHNLIVFTGLSGSGKSSLAFDTIFAEGQRRYVESLSSYARQFLGQMQKPDVDEITGLSPAISIDQKAHSANPRSTVATITEIYDYLRVLYARVGQPSCPDCGTAIRKLTAEEIVDHILKDAAEAAQAAADRFREKGKPKPGETLILASLVRGRKGEYHQLLYDLYNAGFASVRINGRLRSLRTRLVLDRNLQHTIDLVVDSFGPATIAAGGQELRTRLAEAVETALKHGSGTIVAVYADGTEKPYSSKFSCPQCGFSFPEIEPRLFSFNSPYGACPTCHGLGVKDFFSDDVCDVCQGKRLRPESLAVSVGGLNIVEFVGQNIGQARAFVDRLELTGRDAEISVPVLKEIGNRLQFMLDVGLHYLTLDRKAGTLSGGEAQRIRLASQIGSGLVGALYVLDEPSIGLHQRDNQKLLDTLKHLRDIGNTIIVVEHDEETIRAADYLVDFGPGAGKHGGRGILEGAVPAVLEKKSESLTVQYLRGERRVTVPAVRRTKGRDALKVVGAVENNLKNLTVEIPLRRFVCVTGVSGSGKSTLVDDILHQSLSNKLNGTNRPVGRHKTVLGVEYLDRVVMVDQTAIGRTPRSNPATYTGAFDHIREIFSATEEARFRGYRPGRFSFNVPGGRCENCEGNGTNAIEMHFLPTVYVTCDVCGGRRFDRETLAVTYRGKNIHDVLTMTVEEAAKFFQDIPFIHDKLGTLVEVGLGYLELGQSATTLSGGEAQRVKLAFELAKRGSGRAMYILDEPTTGLHFEDVRRLLEVLNKLVERGHSVVCIEHNLDVIKTADYLIDMGPEGGAEGGRVVAMGTPEEVARYADTHTAKYLKRALGL
ncbi:ABC-ATPase UvrA [Candidatus Uhrbacteria bacterium RIFCSPHIGHO2_02_FULL_60_10]|uniref:UvrABC system protein A n=1 Tax=Candidatus Uhrbacteria bacterium RIFCSPHIGHO2_02_FULL_60_10 TaxID=1802392 RepID=A0A1F7U8H4_9BACT|nr:MAG: ABC-ATPase UvrA [Candidatus Uhrbacteria bacterium RIFCSPHIGHO2_02_FULL_60_10]